MYSTIVAFKKANSSFIPYGDDNSKDRERGTILILDRSFDLTSPLMHEYSYQALVYDLLPVENNVLKYKSETGKGSVEKEALLGEQDEVWVELRNSHISQVVETIGARMKDILQNSSGAKLSSSGAKLSVEEMAAAVKQLPEYQQTMSRWGAHTAISSAALSKFIKDNIFPLSKIEQLATTGLYDDDEEGLITLKSGDIFSRVLETVQSMTDKNAKIRLVAIWWIAQKTATEDQKRQMIQAANITGAEQQLLLNFSRLSANSSNLTTAAKQEVKATTGVFSSFFGSSSKPEEAKGGSIVNSRHTPQLKIILEQLQNGDLSITNFPTAGTNAPAKEVKSAAKSVRKFGTGNRWGSKADAGFEGGRVIVFIAGGVSYSEIRSAHEVSAATRKEVIIGSTHIISPANFVEQVSALSAAAAPAPPRP
jgi:syntaxin-binding protein 1